MEQQMMKQLTDSIDKLGDKFDDFGNRLTKIETRFDMFDRSQNNLSIKVDLVEKTANEAHSSTRSAHKRLDGIDGEIEQIPTITAHGQRLEKLESLVSRVLFWISTTVIGGFILGVLSLFINNT